MANLNRIMVIGNVGSEPEMRFTPNGNPVTNFSVATNRRYQVDEEDREETTWFRVQAWNKLAETCNEYLSKGRQVYVDGRLQVRKWEDNEGKPRTSVEIVANTVLFLGSRGEWEEAQEPVPSELEPEETLSPKPKIEEELEPDDIPF